MNHRTTAVCIALTALCLSPTVSPAQDYGSRLGKVKRGGVVSFAPEGPGVLFGALDPAKRKWYVPQELLHEYQWRQWDYSNYARDHFRSYVSTTLEGDYYYDLYGNFITQGWLIFNNSQL